MTPEEKAEIYSDEHKQGVPFPCIDLMEEAYLAGYAAALESDEVKGLLEALENIAAQQGMTNLGKCCVNKTCIPVYDEGEKIAHCQFGYGVNRGFNTCASEATEALAQFEKARLK